MQKSRNWPSMTKVALLFSFAFFSIPLVAGSVATVDCSSLAIHRVTENVNDDVRTPLKGGVHPFARAEFDRGSVDDSLPMEHIILMLQRSPEQELALMTHIDQMHNSRSAQFHQWLRAEQFGACYGIAEADISAVTTWLEAHGFRVDTVPALEFLRREHGHHRNLARSSPKRAKFAHPVNGQRMAAKARYSGGDRAQLASSNLRTL